MVSHDIFIIQIKLSHNTLLRKIGRQSHTSSSLALLLVNDTRHFACNLETWKECTRSSTAIPPVIAIVPTSMAAPPAGPTAPMARGGHAPSKPVVLTDKEGAPPARPAAVMARGSMPPASSDAHLQKKKKRKTHGNVAWPTVIESIARCWDR